MIRCKLVGQTLFVLRLLLHLQYPMLHYYLSCLVMFANWNWWVGTLTQTICSVGLWTLYESCWSRTCQLLSWANWCTTCHINLLMKGRYNNWSQIHLCVRVRQHCTSVQGPYGSILNGWKEVIANRFTWLKIASISMFAISENRSVLRPQLNPSLNLFTSSPAWLIGFVSCDVGCAISARVKGVVHTLSLQKRPLKQARALKVSEVAALEDLVLQPASPVLSIMAGFFLFCVMNCCRFNDAQFAENLQLDRTEDTVILHAGTCQHKTATTADKRTTLLPLVCLGNIFSEESWAVKWIMLMQAEGWSDERA